MLSGTSIGNIVLLYIDAVIYTISIDSCEPFYMNKPIDVIRRCFGDTNILQRMPVSHSDIFTYVYHYMVFAGILNLYVPHFIARCGKLREEHNGVIPSSIHTVQWAAHFLFHDKLGLFVAQV